MSNESELLTLMRKASIEYSVLQLRMLHEYKERMNQLLGSPPADAIVRDEKSAPARKGRGKKADAEKEVAPSRGSGTLSDLVFELTRTSVMAWEQWLRFSTRQLDVTVDMLRKGGAVGGGGGDVHLSGRVAKGGSLDMRFRVRNPYPFRSQLSFGTLSLAKGETHVYPPFRVKRAVPAEDGDELALAPSEEGHFELAIRMDGRAAPGSYNGEVPVYLERAVVGRLVVKVEVSGARKASKRPKRRGRKP